MQQYSCVRFDVLDPGLADILAAELAALEYEGFEMNDGHILAYIPSKLFNKARLNGLAERYAATSGGQVRLAGVGLVPQQNWNQAWESNFKPVIIGNDLLVKADFHTIDPKQFKHSINIHPRMAFGTGHHETTELMMRQMLQTPFGGKEVLDFGCGTGILAILAKMLGASSVLAVDNDPNAVENTQLNLEKNNISGVEAVLSDDAAFAGLTFDLVLANINRNVILQTFPGIAAALKAGGQVLFSGILGDDEPLIMEQAALHPLNLVARHQKGGWLMLAFARNAL